MIRYKYQKPGLINFNNFGIAFGHGCEAGSGNNTHCQPGTSAAAQDGCQDGTAAYPIGCFDGSWVAQPCHNGNSPL